jgi:two-component sensor histidine kinase
MLVSADHTIPLGLLINELVTNAVKYAYPEGSGDIKVSAREIEGHFHVEVCDEGVGLPNGFDLDKPSASLGFKVVADMVRQLQGHLSFASNDLKGTRFVLDFLSFQKPKKTCSDPRTSLAAVRRLSVRSCQRPWLLMVKS